MPWLENMMMRRDDDILTYSKEGENLVYNDGSLLL